MSNVFFKKFTDEGIEKITFMFVDDNFECYTCIQVFVCKVSHVILVLVMLHFVFNYIVSNCFAKKLFEPPKSAVVFRKKKD